MEWEPIETAPRDGTKVLLGNSEAHFEPIEIGEYYQIKRTDFEEIEGDEHYNVKIFRAVESISHEGWNCGFEPTHWQPLPKPPTKEISDE